MTHMDTLSLVLRHEPDGVINTEAKSGNKSWSYPVAADQVNDLLNRAQSLTENFAIGTRPLADPVQLVELGSLLQSILLGPLATDLASPFLAAEGSIKIHSASSDLLNLPWELLPGRTTRFLIDDGRWAIRRTTRAKATESSRPLVPRPLRLLFTACAPSDQPNLDFEKEEETILRIADQLGDKLHLDIAEAGSFDDLVTLISQRKPHVVHLSGHGRVKEGLGYFAFENERGQLDEREGREMAARLFADSGVRLVFVSGCQSAQAGIAGLCQALTEDGHVPVAIGWGASIADDRATEFARILFHELAVGHGLDHAMNAARRHLLDKGRVRIGGQELLDASFVLPRLYAAENVDDLIDEKRPLEKPDRPRVVIRSSPTTSVVCGKDLSAAAACSSASDLP